MVAERKVIRHTLAQLPEALRTPLLLSLVGGLSSSEIAALLEVGEAAVRRLYTAGSRDTLVEAASTPAW